MTSKNLYVEASLMSLTGSVMAGIDCSPVNERRVLTGLCSPARPSYCQNPALGAPSSGYNACASEFFQPYTANPRYKSFQPSVVAQAVRESKMVALLEQYADELHRQPNAEAAAYRVTYRAAFENAATLADVQAFETRYANNDPDGLIPKLAERKRGLQVQEYRRRFDTMRSEQNIESFIADYTNDDPEEKLPKARRLLVEAKNRTILENQRAAEQEADTIRAKKVESLERIIVWCKRESTAARIAVERENKIGAVSGYVNKMTLREAGEVIVSCDEAVPRDYAEYKRLGGRRALADLK